MTRTCRRRGSTSYARELAGLTLAGLLLSVQGVPAQTVTRRATDLASLAVYAAFYHGQPVVVRAEVVLTDDAFFLVSDDGTRTIRLLAEDGQSIPTGRVEARGVFWDVGRFAPNDPRVRTNGLSDALPGGRGGEVLPDEWPKPGEILVFRLTDAFRTALESTPSLRDVALDASRYVGERVTVVGQFRGRNLYGDLPQSPSLSRWDFVVKRADAALWVAGARPRGNGFELDVSARADTGRWLEVSGIVRQEGGLVWLESPEMTLTKAPALDNAASEEVVERLAGPPPVVVFSVPTADDLDVRLDAAVRIQFSRDMDADSFDEHVRVRYGRTGTPADSDVTRATAVPPFSTAYDAASRALTIQFDEPFPGDRRFAVVSVLLQEGITARDGAALAPWTLSFTLGDQ